MRIVPFRIPKQVVLPGLVVQVRQVTARELPDSDGDWQCDMETGEALIRLRRHLSLTHKRYILLHELQHVLTDYTDAALTSHSQHFRV